MVAVGRGRLVPVFLLQQTFFLNKFTFESMQKKKKNSCDNLFDESPPPLQLSKMMLRACKGGSVFFPFQESLKPVI